MQEKQLFEYAVIRLVPSVERQEFINVGVILFCARQGFLNTIFEINPNRLLAFSPDLDVEDVRERLSAFQIICKGGKEGGAIGGLPISGRFRWLTAARSTVIQTSPVHPGLCIDPSEALEQLFVQLVK